MSSSELGTPLTGAALERARAVLLWLGIGVLAIAAAVAFAGSYLSSRLGDVQLQPRACRPCDDEGRFERLLQILDQRDRYEEYDTAVRFAEAVAPAHRSDSLVNWVAGIAPLSGDRFLAVQQVIGEGRIFLGVYDRGGESTDYWTSRRGHRSWRYSDEGTAPSPLAQIWIASDLREGRHEVAFPDLFLSLEEFIAVVQRDDDAPGPGQRALYIGRPKRNEIEVVSTRWHFGQPGMGCHNDIERLFRDPVTGRLFGDGSHLRPFVLKEGAREVEAWLR